MAEGEAAAGGLKEALSKKIGPLPAGVWILGIGGVWYYIKKKQSASSATGTTAAQRDPAGNTGTIDPSTGYVYGSPEDTAALAANQTSGGSSGSGSNPSTTAGQYATNQDWARAAINYLVGIGIDPTTANTAVTQFVGSQTLSTAQQADINLAIQAIGSPPNPPTPGGTPVPIVNPPSPGTTYATNPPTGLTVSGSTTSTITVTWNLSSNAQAYTVTAIPAAGGGGFGIGGGSSGGGSQTQTVSGTAGTATLTGLSPNTLYTVQVQATPAKPGDPYASVSAHTAAGTPVALPGGGGAPPPIPVGPITPPPTGPAGAATHVYTVQHGDNLSAIAARNGITLATIKQLNPVYWTDPKYNQGNLIFAGDSVTLPGSG